MAPKTNTAENVTETPEQKLARLMAENEVMSKAIEASGGADTDHVEFSMSTNGKTRTSGTAERKTFSSGSRGFYWNGKVSIGGKRYQSAVQLVEIGSKPVQS